MLQNDKQTLGIAIMTESCSIGTEDITWEPSETAFDLRSSAVDLLCRRESSIVFLWKNLDPFDLTLSLKEDSENAWKPPHYSYDVDQNWVTIENLKPETNYSLRVTDGTYLSFEDPVEYQFMTLSGNMTLGAVPWINITLDEVVPEGAIVTVEWFPVKELACDYKLTLWSITDGEVQHFLPMPHEFYRATLGPFLLSRRLSLRLMAFSESADGPEVVFDFETPPCFLHKQYNATECIVDPPSNLEWLKIDDGCALLLRWHQPTFAPDSYVIKIYNEYSYEPSRTVELKPNITTYEIDLHLFGNKLFIFLSSTKGTKSSKNSYLEYNNDKCRGVTDLQTLSVVYLTVTLICFIAFAFVLYILRQRYKGNRSKSWQINFTEKETESRTTELSSKEPKIKSLILKELLGEGEFGIVQKGFIKGKPVAVKTLKGGGSCKSLELMKKEIEIMRRVGSHKHVVSLITYSMKEMLIIVEYCELGDLLNYLRKAWSIKQKINNEIFSNSSICYVGQIFETPAMVAPNQMYCTSDDAKKLMALSTVDMLSFARQIALGMEYLSSKNIVHRDLAARNILLTSKMIAKISDFGLSRELRHQSEYKNSNGAKLPLRWMAPESFSRHLFTVKSDIWSFGVLFWEICTLGSTPYGMLEPYEIIVFLRKGHCLEKPPPCSEEMYNLMTSCWQLDPSARPTFKELAALIDYALSRESPNKYMTVNLVSRSYINLSSDPRERKTSSNSKYLYYYIK